MIFTDKKLNKGDVSVRFYRYSDPNMGRGDAGTVMYAKIPRKAFVETEKKRDGKAQEEFGSYYTYSFTTEWYDKLKKTFGSDYWHMGTSYELAVPAKRNAEIKEHEEALARISHYKHFV